MQATSKNSPALNRLKILSIDAISSIIRAEKNSKKIPLTEMLCKYQKVNLSEEISKEIQQTIQTFKDKHAKS